MSVDFAPVLVGVDGVARPLHRCNCEDMTCRACETRLNCHERRASDLIAAVGLPARYGVLPAADLVARCEAYLRRLAPEPVRPGLERGRLVVGGAPAGDTRDTVARLLVVAQDALAAGGWVAWS